jgi:hypothetical protein
MPGADTIGTTREGAQSLLACVSARAARAPCSWVIGSLHDVLHSTAFEIARTVTFAVLVTLWLGVAFWVYRDARRRIDDAWLVATATLVGLVPVVGFFVYLLFRPPETLADRYARRVEVGVLEDRLLRTAPHCPVCRTGIEPAFLVCPVCTTRLKEPCRSCAAPLEPLWQTCPYCATPAVAAPSAADLDAALTAEARLHAPARASVQRARAAD